MRKSVVRCGIILFAAFSLPMIAIAPEAGAFSFSERMPDGKLCRVLLGEPHVHAANGARPDKSAAQMKAIRDWSSFTVFEYGRRWGNWSHAVGHSMTCMNDTEAGVWRCRAKAQPCKAEPQAYVMHGPNPVVRGYVARDGRGGAVHPRATGCGSLLSCVMDFVPFNLNWLRR